MVELSIYWDIKSYQTAILPPSKDLLQSIVSLLRQTHALLTIYTCTCMYLKGNQSTHLNL